MDRLIDVLSNGLGTLIGWAWFYLIPVRRGVVLQNLAVAFPSMSDASRWELARNNFYYYGRTFVEMIFIPWKSFSRIQQQVEMTEQDWGPIRSVLAENRGAFFLMAHLGNWEYAALFGASHHVPLSIVTKAFSKPWMQKLWARVRKIKGIEYIPASGTARAVIGSVKAGRFVAMMLDQHMQPPVGVETRFFGLPVGTIRSLAHLSAHLQIPVIPLGIVRTHRSRFRLFTEDPLCPPSVVGLTVEEKDRVIKNLTQRYCDVIERWVRSFPEQWNWLHRRFKLSYNYQEYAKVPTHPSSVPVSSTDSLHEKISSH